MQHGADAEQTVGAQRVEPRVAVGDVGSESAKRPHVARARRGRAGDEVHEHLGRGLIHPENGDPLAGAQVEGFEAQRPQATVVLDDVADLQERLASVAHRRVFLGGYGYWRRCSRSRCQCASGNVTAPGRNANAGSWKSDPPVTSRSRSRAMAAYLSTVAAS